MATKRHVWIKTKRKREDGTPSPDFCERCGCDRDSPQAKQGCRPTTLPGF